MKAHRQAGFTLIEIIIVVAILGVIAAVALPSYRDSVMKSRRADAKSALTQAAQAMEKYFTENNTYVGATLSSIYRTTSPDGYYNISFTATPTAASYTLQAAPASGKGQQNDQCGTFTLTNTGVKGATIDATLCW